MKTLKRKMDIPANLRPKITIDVSLPDLSNHPVVLKKAADARNFLEEHPIPDYILNRRKR